MDAVKDSNDNWIEISASAASDVDVTVNFADDAGVGLYEHTSGHLDKLTDEGGNFTGYKFTTDKFVAGFVDTETSEADNITKHTITYTELTNDQKGKSENYCTIEDLTQGLTAVADNSAAYTYTIYKDDTPVGTIANNIITITDKAAFDSACAVPETAQTFTVKVIDTQGSQALGAYFFAFEIVLSPDITENFTYNNDTYTYTATGSTPAGQNFHD